MLTVCKDHSTERLTAHRRNRSSDVNPIRFIRACRVACYQYVGAIDGRHLHLDRKGNTLGPTVSRYGANPSANANSVISPSGLRGTSKSYAPVPSQENMYWPLASTMAQIGVPSARRTFP